MIRERREEDLDGLCLILENLDYPSGILAGNDLKEWLNEYDAEQSWVFDSAPVTVVPTKNVVGHIQIYRPTENASASYLAKHASKVTDDLLSIGKLFVGPNKHEYGIRRHLLKEAVKYIQRQGKLPVLDLHENEFLSKGFCEKFGFEEIPSVDCHVY
ncbi:GNAT family N-acetyltransferase [Arthrobacter castelli]|uniref:GNAT family N-acetyltransferase n=1 Tax=Arthrobacter castelli TaxID=271431 RepID=UPI0003FBC5D0|nr:GNAT family N-acetyltransferase [Arthrobacter castelli]